MISVAITGGIGSGKTTVCKIIKAIWSIPIYFADDRAKWLMENDNELKTFILNIFGTQAFNNDKLNKAYIAKKIFSDNNYKTKLESFVHKKVINDYYEWRNLNNNFVYTIFESAIVFEANIYSYFDKIILVTAPVDLRIERLINRGFSKKEVLQRMKNQLSDDDKTKRCDYIIENDENKSLIEQIINIHNSLIKK
jgi:dephospho-CoA kinase